MGYWLVSLFITAVSPTVRSLSETVTQRLRQPMSWLKMIITLGFVSVRELFLSPTPRPHDLGDLLRMTFMH